MQSFISSCRLDFSLYEDLVLIRLFRSPQWALSSSIAPTGTWQLNSRMVQKHLAREKRRSGIHWKEGESHFKWCKSCFFPCPIAPHTLWQGVFVSLDCLAAKGPLPGSSRIRWKRFHMMALIAWTHFETTLVIDTTRTITWKPASTELDELRCCQDLNFCAKKM